MFQDSTVHLIVGNVDRNSESDVCVWGGGVRGEVVVARSPGVPPRRNKSEVSVRML